VTSKAFGEFGRFGTVPTNLSDKKKSENPITYRASLAVSAATSSAIF